MNNNYPNLSADHLAWHETLEIHELVAFQSIGLMKLKKTYPEVADPELKHLYKTAIDGISRNIRELLQFYPMAPLMERKGKEMGEELSSFFVGDLLGLAKVSVRNYALAITETSTPAVRKVLLRHLLGAIELHAKIFNYMNEKEYYPSYDLKRLLQNDISLANKALTK
ncbi:spore coat protein [Sporolactobacillus sp. THM7-4]|nr:spore coat protein [Sporolactobacillus sp. THM7-4]